MADVDEFINKFHSLEGVTLKEKKRNLHGLLTSYKNASQDILDYLVPKLICSTYLEETFKIEVLLYFKRSEDLLNVLKSGDEIGACKIVRQGWFVQGLMDKFSAEQFVKEVFPHLSLSIRLKLLRTYLIYTKDENKIQNLFDELLKSYGWRVASILLTGCPDENIKDILVKSFGHFKLSPTKLMQLFDKNKDLITFYFELLKSNDEQVNDYKWRSVFNYLRKKDPVYFYDFAKKYDIYIGRFGRQNTKKFLEIKKDEILKKPNEFCNYLRKDALVRKLGKDFPIFFKNGLPKQMKELHYDYVKSLLHYYIKGKQYQLYYDTFEEIYKKTLWDNIDYMEERLIEFIPDKEEREKWIKKFENRENYVKYQPKAMGMSLRCVAMSSDAAMEFDEDYDLSNEAAIAEKKTIFNTLINTCKLNQDYDAFLNILNSFCQRHRNSDVTILYNFLRTVYKELDMKKLTEKHWKYIHEIITIQLFKKQKIFCPMLVEYIKFLYLNQKPIEDQVLNLMKELPPNLAEFEYDNDAFEKVMLQLYVTLLPKVDDKKNTLAVQITLAVKKWLSKHPQDIISLHDQPVLLNAFTQLKDTEKPPAQMMKAFKFLVCKQEGNDEITSLDEIYWTNLKNLNDKTLTKWYLKYKPTVLKNYLEKIGIILRDKNVNLVRMLKKFDHLGMPSIITQLCMGELEKAEPSKRERVIKILVFFMPRQDFFSFFKQHIPKVDKVDVTDENEETKKIYEVQCALAKHFKCTLYLKEGLPDLLKYCRGDVLGSALPSLYSSFCRIPEKELYSALEDLSKKAVSVRKHSIYFSALILPVDKVLLKYQKIGDEKHVSVKQHSFLSCYKYFKQNDIPECWPILKSYIEQLKKQQKDILNALTEVHDIPQKFRDAYLETVWTKFEELRKSTEEFDNNMDKLLRNLRKSDVLLLRKEFCKEIIEKKLFDLTNCCMRDAVSGLTYDFLLYGGDTEEKVAFIFQCLQNFRNKFWNDDETKIKALQTMNSFCFNMFQGILKGDAKNFDTNFPKLFADAWKKEFSLDETFEENLLIDFVIIKVSSGANSDSLVKDISKVFSGSLEKYGTLILDNFRKFMSSFLRQYFRDEKNNIKFLGFLENLLETNSSVECCALVVDLLPRGYSSSEEEKAIHKKLMEKLLQKDQIIKIRLYGKIKDLNYY